MHLSENATAAIQADPSHASGGHGQIDFMGALFVFIDRKSVV